MEYTSEQLNYFRICYIAFNLVPEGLRTIFKQEWDFLYKTTLGEWKDTPKNGLDFYNNESRRSRSKNARCLATIQNGNTTEWDCSCLFFAILFSDSIGTSLGPAVNRDVDDLRKVRNDIAHISEAKLTDAEFMGYVGRVLLAFNSLKLPISNIAKVKNQTSFPTAEGNSLKLQADNLKQELNKAKSDFQVAQNTLKTKEEQVHTLTTDLQVAQDTMQKKEDQVQNLACDLQVAQDTMQKKEDQVQTLTSDLQVAQDTMQKKEDQVENLTCDLQVAQDTMQKKEDQVQNLTCDLQVAQTDLQVAQDSMLRKEEHVECLTQEINSKVESFCNLTFKPAHEIIRRSNDVTRIMTKMQELQDRSHGAVSTIYFSGNPGCGKSQIARQIAQEIFTVRSRESDGLTFVATLNAKTLETLADSYIGLAKQVGITEYTLTNLATSKVNSPKEIIQHIQCLILPKIKQFSKWIVIADNVVDLSMVRSYLPQTSSEEWGHGQVLITSQDSSCIPTSAPHTYHESLSTGMQPDDALELLKQVSQISNHEQAKQVAEVLEYQPLALAAAAFYVLTVVSHGSPNYSWTNYLEEFGRGAEREATEEPLARENTAYSKTMTTAIRMAISSSSESDEVLCQAFCFLSLCASESLPIEAAVNFVKVCTSGHTEDLIKAKILKSSLITCLYSEDGVPEYLRVHNVVYHVLKKLSTFDSKTVQRLSHAISIFHSLTESESKHVFESRQVCLKLRKVTTHCKVLHDILFATFAATGISVKDLTPFISPEKVVSWLCSTAAVCCNLTNPSDANLFSKSACDFAHYINSTREGDVLKADVYTVRGRALSMQCQYKLSISYHEKANNIYTAIYGEEHGKVATNYNYLGDVYCTIGNYNQAKEYHEKALIVSKKIYGEEHADVARSYNHLGNVYRKLTQNSQAKEYHEKALIILKNIHGEENAHVARNYTYLGNNYLSLGKYNQAKEYDEKALYIWKNIYGEEHADVATSYNNLGVDHYRLGQYDQAQEYHEKALYIRKKIYGEEHADVATSYNSLGNDHLGLRQYNQAQEYHKKALVIWKSIFGEEHADVASCYNSLGTDHCGLGQYNDALEYHEKALYIRRKIYGEEHARVAICYKNVGDDHWGLGQYGQAKEYHEKELIILKNIYGEEHAHVARNYNYLGYDYLNLGQYDQAKEYHEKALYIQKKIYGEKHADVGTSYNNLGVDHYRLGQYEQAQEYHEKALAIRKKNYGEEHADVAISCNNLGNDHLGLGQYDQALEYHEKALYIRRKIYGEEHARVATCYKNVGDDHYGLGQYNQAQEYYKKALAIQKKIYGEEHADVATSYKNLSIVDSNFRRRNQSRTNNCILL